MDIDVNLKIFSFNWIITIKKQWVKFGIIMVAILMSMVVSFWGSQRILMLIPLLLIGIAILLLLLRQINIGFILILLASMFIPFTGPGGVNATVLIVAIILFLWLINMLVIKRNFYFIRSRALLPVVIFLVISVIAFGMGQLPWFQFANQAPLDAQMGGFSIFILSLGLMLATAHLIQNIEWLEIIVWVFLGFSALYIIGRLFNLPVDRFYQQGFRAGSMFWTWLVALSFSQFIFNRNLKKSIRIFLLIMIIVIFYVAMIRGYDWKSGWVPPLVAIAVMMGLKYRRLVILAVPFALITVGNLAARLIASDRYSWGTRVDAWEIVLEISKVSPLFGLGFSNYYWYTPLFPIRGWVVSFNSHSQFVDLIAQVGVLGLLGFLWIFFEMGRIGWGLLKKQLPDGFTKAYAYGTFAGVISTLVGAFLGDWVLPFIYNVGLSGFRSSILPWIFMGGLLAVEQFMIRKVRVV